MRVGCVIMASGEGKRFGGNKLMADFLGEPLICRSFRVTEGLFFRRIVVTRHKDVENLCRKKGIEVICHDLPFRNDTMRLGLEALEDMDGCLFCPGDQPMLRKETVEALVCSFEQEREMIWRPSFEEKPGAPVLFPKWTFSELKSLQEGMGGREVIKKYPERVRMVPVRDKYELMDVDRPEDLAILQEQ